MRVHGLETVVHDSTSPLTVICGVPVLGVFLGEVIFCGGESDSAGM